MKDKKLSSSTKSAANEERDRRKRMEEKQKLYNQLFETKETKEVCVENCKEKKKQLFSVTFFFAHLRRTSPRF